MFQVKEQPAAISRSLGSKRAFLGDSPCSSPEHRGARAFLVPLRPVLHLPVLRHLSTAPESCCVKGWQSSICSAGREGVQREVCRTGLSGRPVLGLQLLLGREAVPTETGNILGPCRHHFPSLPVAPFSSSNSPFYFLSERSVE